jgi:pyruvate/2-oxoacid:ferredoxin oxidoreductase alpha subunit
MAHNTPVYKKATFDFEPEVARKLAELKHELQYDEGFAASDASGVAIVSALIMNATAKQVAKLLKRGL